MPMKAVMNDISKQHGRPRPPRPDLRFNPLRTIPIVVIPLNHPIAICQFQSKVTQIAKRSRRDFLNSDLTDISRFNTDGFFPIIKN